MIPLEPTPGNGRVPLGRAEIATANTKKATSSNTNSSVQRMDRGLERGWEGQGPMITPPKRKCEDESELQRYTAFQGFACERKR